MRFEQTLLEGTLVSRETTFAVNVRLDSGEEIEVHCPNPGSLAGCAEPGNRVLVSESTSPHSRFKHHLEVIYAGKVPVGIHTARPSSVLVEAIGKGKIPELAGYATLKRGGRNTNGTRIDLIVEGNGLRACHIKVVTVSWERDGIASFPDTLIDTAHTEMQDLTNLVREGNRAMLIFLALRNDVSKFQPAEDVDPEYVQTLRDAVARGVELLSFRSKVTKRGIELDQLLEVDMGEG